MSMSTMRQLITTQSRGDSGGNTDLFHCLELFDMQNINISLYCYLMTSFVKTDVRMLGFSVAMSY